jgi:hypothetical protein
MTVAVEAQRAHAACVCAHLPHDVMGQHGTCHVSLSACQDNPWGARCHIRPAPVHAADDVQHRITHRSQQAVWHAAGGTGRTDGRRVVQAATPSLRPVRAVLHVARGPPLVASCGRRGMQPRFPTAHLCTQHERLLVRHSRECLQQHRWRGEGSCRVVQLCGCSIRRFAIYSHQ